MSLTEKISALVLAVSVMGINVPSAAQDHDQLYKKCFNSTVAGDVVVGCSFVIARENVSEIDLATAFKNRGNAYDDQGKYALALQDYDRAIATNPQDADAFNSRGTTKTALKRYALAIEDFDEAIRLNPASPLAYSNRCFAKAMQEDLQGALADCNEALSVRAGNPSAFASRGFVNLLLRRYDAAIADYDAELKIRADDAYSLYGRAVAKYKKGDLKGADRDLVQAQSVKPDISEHMASFGIEVGKF